MNFMQPKFVVKIRQPEEYTQEVLVHAFQTIFILPHLKTSKSRQLRLRPDDV